MQLRGKRALVTGASAGIGTALAKRLAAQGCDLVLVARRLERLEELASSLSRDHGIGVDVIVADLADAAAPERIHKELQARPLDILVNNAGYGISGEFGETPWAAHATFLQVMVTAVVNLTHLCLPAMLERGSGHIVQIGSIAGLLPGSATNTLYAASKAFLVRFTESLSAELSGTGVHVTAVCPGLTHSEFHDVIQTRETVSQIPSAFWQTADDVAEEAIAAMRRGAIVHVTGNVNRAVESVVRHLPQGVARRMFRPRR